MATVNSTTVNTVNIGENLMKSRTRSFLATGALVSALFMASPYLMADEHHKKHHGDRKDIAQMCEDFKAGKGRFDKQERREKMQEHQAELADRLKLDDEQREIWKQIHDERREKHEKRAAKFHEKLEKRCAEQEG
jgi:hypothetical protein